MPVKESLVSFGSEAVITVTECYGEKKLILILHQTLRRIPERIPGNYCLTGIMYSSQPSTYWLYTRYSDGSRHAVKLNVDYMHLDAELTKIVNEHCLELIRRFCLT